MKTQFVVRYSLALALMAGVGCADNGTGPQAGPIGLYDYVASDSLGGLYEQGILLLSVVEGATVEGSWIFGRSGKGDLVGSISDDHFSLNLHPGWADHNLLLDGSVGSDVLTGRWVWVGFAGPMEGGPFIARRR